MISILIAEDSQENIETLQYFLTNSPVGCRVDAIAKTLEESKEMLQSGAYDLALLDIQFKKGTIFEVLDELVKQKLLLPNIIFITAHGSFEYAVKAIQYACLDFINKPVKADQVYEVLHQVATTQLSQSEQSHRINMLLELIEGDLKSPEKLGIVRAKNMVEYIHIKDLLYVKADGNTSIFTISRNTFHSTKHLGYYIDLFNEHEGILQISRFCIVNRENIASYNPSTREIKMINGDILQVSHRANKHIKRTLKIGVKSSLLSKLDQLKHLLSDK